MGWSALTRPFSTLALLLPLGTIVLWTAARRKRWRDVAVAGLVGGALLLVIPLWSARTTGDPWTTPYALYSRIYFPYQRPGFGAPPAEPLRPLSNDMRAYADEFRSLHAEHTIANLPRIARRRLAALARGSWGGWRAPLLVFAIAGLFSLTRESGFAVVSALVFFLQYLFLAHSRGWTVYYLEIQPVLALVTALGIWRAASLAGARLRRSARAGLWPPGRFEAAAVLLVVFAAIGPAVFDAVWRREEQLLEAAPQERFRRVVRSIPGPAVIFVRYGPDHDSHRSLVVNAPDSGAAATWIVHDRGEDNARLMRAAPERIPSLYDETLGELRPLARPAPL
jgi:hypothetical protein